MASSAARLAVFFLILLADAVVPSLGSSYVVGDVSGWALNVDYSLWTYGKTFNVGDNLVFYYGSGHTVDRVNARDYSSCSVENPITTSDTGSTTITLDSPGYYYFICGAIGHCSSGMKLAVAVAASTVSVSI
ncbi:hypothetical protein DCAR_0831491 [Daucus carota subsp. sativus]|uniref:Phytocyanin domain-containing protein n=1 Tax=Daucus carota subsp. sativus TaxID=79200 RepID=A0AAF0XQ90_DAUCS|nr:PREDICTED: blue copper protein-like [Daucus carota subsp. sativus]WOH11995.1 hypothetical protein DCAR_0831491 [Daucus carota subsp. sativus]